MIAAGDAYVRAESSGARTVLTHARAASPLRLLTPRGRNPATAWIVTSTFGGGLVGGDSVALELDVRPGARVLVTSQSSTKVYRSARPARQRLEARVAAGACLIVLPDPIAAFAGSRFEQEQGYELDADASLVTLDWMSNGRHARGEEWQFDRYISRLVIRRDGRDVFRDRLALSADDGDIGARMRPFTTYGVLAIAGRLMEGMRSALVAAIDAVPAQADADLVSAAASFDEGRGTVIRFAARDLERAAATVGGMLEPLYRLLGDDPWSRRGTPLCI